MVYTTIRQHGDVAILVKVKMPGGPAFFVQKRVGVSKRICNETKALEAYKDDRRPVFKSSSSQFMTVIYSVDY